MNFSDDQLLEVVQLKADIRQIKADIVKAALQGQVDSMAELAKTILIREARLATLAQAAARQRLEAFQNSPLNRAIAALYNANK